MTKSPAVALLMAVLCACSSVRLHYEGLAKTGDVATPVVMEKSYSIRSTQVWCIITGALYGGWCWTYFFLPTYDQKAQLIADAKVAAENEAPGSKAEMLYSKVTRQSWQKSETYFRMDHSRTEPYPPPPIAQEQSSSTATDRASNPDTTPARKARPFNPDSPFKEYIVKTNLPAKVAYERAKTWAATAYVHDSKSAIQIDEPDAAKFVAKGFLGQCSAFGSIRPYEVSFLLDFRAKPNRVRIFFDKILVTPWGQQSGADRSNVFSGLLHDKFPKNAEDLEQIASHCLEPIKDQIERELRSTKGSDEW